MKVKAKKPSQKMKARNLKFAYTLLAACAFFSEAKHYTATREYEIRALQRAEGVIQQDKYIALILPHQTSSEHSELFLLKDFNGLAEVVVRIVDAPTDGSMSLSVRNNSFFIRQDFAHNGVRYFQYQFKKIGSYFYLAGIEAQSMDSGSNYAEIWTGFNTNFLSGKSTCWIKKISSVRGPESRNWRRWKFALVQLENGITPVDAKITFINAKPKKLVPLANFDLYENHESPVCHFR